MKHKGWDGNQNTQRPKLANFAVCENPTLWAQLIQMNIKGSMNIRDVHSVLIEGMCAACMLYIVLNIGVTFFSIVNNLSRSRKSI